MKSLAQEYAEYSRTSEGDGSIRPTVDTGFRMKATAPSTYTPRPNPIKGRHLDYVHVDDVPTVEPTRLRGVNYITVDYDAAQARHIADIQRNIAARKAREANGG